MSVPKGEAQTEPAPVSLPLGEPVVFHSMAILLRDRNRVLISLFFSLRLKHGL